ncbi:hypothetical protein [Tessaracoccus sp.]
MLALSIVTITLALILHTVGIWGERFQRTLKRWQAVFFGLGLTADTTALC